MFFAAIAIARAAPLRVCADPSDLPFSDVAGHGFENEIAQVVSRNLKRPLEYRWIPQRDKFFKAIEQGACDMAMEAPVGLPDIRTTRPFYRSSYVFVTRRDRHLHLHGLADPRLAKLKIALAALGADTASAPAARPLAARGILRNVTWYRLYQNYLGVNHPEAPVEAVARGEVDVAIVWGPTAGYFAKQSKTPLNVTPITGALARANGLTFSLAMAVHPGDEQLLRQLNGIIARRGPEIRRILTRYGVPMTEGSRQK
ncbi:MAG TPA: quinoprotein dehydrogenase-associated putative ABC transporter substrate-binding protein [Bryobacteraceae bacterium]|nr:quinoprotein dehydrogenase-associated putative ABC transporter substrate-binding protein [Bryobacteraceae bacterium]